MVLVDMIVIDIRIQYIQYIYTHICIPLYITYLCILHTYIYIHICICVYLYTHTFFFQIPRFMGRVLSCCATEAPKAAEAVVSTGRGNKLGEDWGEDLDSKRNLIRVLSSIELVGGFKYFLFSPRKLGK